MPCRPVACIKACARRPFLLILVLVTALPLLGADPARSMESVTTATVTDAEVVGFLMELQDVLKSRDADRLVTFVESRYADEVTIGLTINLTMIGQEKPFVQQVSLNKEEQIAQFRQAAPLYAMSKDYDFALTIKDVLVEAGGAKARALYEAKESAVFDAHTAEGEAVTVRHRTAARCSVLIVPGPEEPMISQLDCVYNTTADQP